MKRFLMILLTGLSLAACQKAPTAATALTEDMLDGRDLAEVSGRGAIVNRGGLVDAHLSLGAFTLGNGFPMHWTLHVTSPSGLTLVRCAKYESGDRVVQTDANSVDIDFSSYQMRDEVVLRLTANAPLTITGQVATLPGNKAVPNPLTIPLSISALGVPGLFHFDQNFFNRSAYFGGWLIKKKPSDDPATCNN